MYHNTKMNYINKKPQRVVLVNPPIVAGCSDQTGTGVPYMPITLAILAAILDGKYDVSVMDMFGRNPVKKTKHNNLMLFGVDLDVISTGIRKDDVVIIYSGHAIGHTTVLRLIEKIQEYKPKKVIVVENTNFVNAYPLDLFYGDFKKVGATIIAGDPYDAVEKAIDGDYDMKDRHQCWNVDSLPAPKWDKFPLENYWNLDYAHAPKTDKKYIQMYTALGCSGGCYFCVNFYMNKSHWRPRSAWNIVKEMEDWYWRGVKEFHLEDMNPLLSVDRVNEICSLLEEKSLKVDIKVAAGSKLDHIDVATLCRMGRVGFTYLSFSPESGSPNLVELMGKKFNHDRILWLMWYMPKSIITQACFILGYPGEKGVDQDLTHRYAKQLSEAGVDEFAFFDYLPSPGSSMGLNYSINTDELTFSSDWRPYNKHLKALRMSWLFELYFDKFIRNPVEFMARIVKTKTYMSLKRLSKTITI